MSEAGHSTTAELDKVVGTTADKQRRPMEGDAAGISESIAAIPCCGMDSLKGLHKATVIGK